MMVVYGYARLVALQRRPQLEPDILESVEVEDDRVFTLHLRPGHRWSDGQPFTAEDFRYCWEDVANNPDLPPAGPPPELLSDGEPPKFEVLDAITVRYSWTEPNPHLPAGAGGGAPARHLRPGALPEEVPREIRRQGGAEELGSKEAGQQELGAAPRPDGQASTTTTIRTCRRSSPGSTRPRPPAERFVFVRNPYYHRVDADGRQLPYIDRVAGAVADGKIIPAKAGAGEADLQARYIRFDNYTFLKQAAKRNDYKVGCGSAAQRRAAGALPQPQRQRPGLAGAVPRRRGSAARFARHQPARDQPGDLLRPGAATARTRCCRRRPCSSRSTGRPGPTTTWPRPTGCSTRSA